MNDLVATLSENGQIAIPDEVTQFLGLPPHDSVVFAIDGREVRLLPTMFSLDDLFNSVEPIAD